MQAIQQHLFQKSSNKMTYTAELIPEQYPDGSLFVLHLFSIPPTNHLFSQWRLTPKQDHLVCFLGGSLMLGATITGSYVDPASVPPRPKELTPSGMRDWIAGEELIKTCMATHDTATCALLFHSASNASHPCILAVYLLRSCTSEYRVMGSTATIRSCQQTGISRVPSKQIDGRSMPRECSNILLDPVHSHHTMRDTYFGTSFLVNRKAYLLSNLMQAGNC